MDFTEHSKLEAGFAPIFRETILPKLQQLESERVELLGTTRKIIAVILAVAIFLTATILWFWGDSAFGFFSAAVFVFFGIAGSVFLWKVQTSGWTSSVADTVMPPICEHVGNLNYENHRLAGFPLQNIRDMGLLPHYDNSDLSSRLDGTYRGTSYDMVKAELTKTTRGSNNNDTTSTVFSGLLFHIEVPAKSPGRIMIMRDRGGFGNKLGEMLSFGGARSMPKLDFDHAAFEDAFEVYAENPDTARSYMPKMFRDSLLAIGESEGGRRGAKAMLAGFEGTSFYLVLSRGGAFMQMGKLTKSVTEIEDDLHAIFDDIELSHRIIDRLHGVAE